LYQHNATVYVAGRSQEKGENAITKLKKQFPNSKGKLTFLKLDLADRSTIKVSVEEFMSKESRLDVLTQNAGVMVPPSGSKDMDGHELQMGTNCLGPWLFAQCLLPVLKKTAASSPPGSVRVTWATSIAIAFSPTGGVVFQQDGFPTVHCLQSLNYIQSKIGNVYLASEFAARYGRNGIISVSWNPGNLSTELLRHCAAILKMMLDAFVLFPPVFGGYTELYAACSPSITASQNGCFLVPWGRIGYLRSDMIKAQKSVAEGGTGEAQKFWDWCERQCKAHM
jgi:retinol dehydrogenase-12